MTVDPDMALAALVRKPLPFNLAKFCFAEQHAFINDDRRYKAACCSRRAGKTTGCAGYLLNTAIKSPGVACLYLTLTRLQAKRIIWEPLKEICEVHSIPAVFNETELTVRLPNKSVIYLSGAKDKEEVKKYLGFPLKLVVIDESQSFRSYLRELVDDVIAPTLFDWAGTLAMIGVPGPVPVGYFYEVTQSKQWANYAWTMMHNPFLKAKSGREPMELIQEECMRRGIPLDHPSIQRQCFGRWVNDSNARVFKWEEKNHFDHVPLADGWDYIIGVDLGYADADAVAVIGWSSGLPAAYLVEEIVTPKQGITPLVAQITKMITKYKPLSVVMDTGGLGKKIAEEMIVRHGLPIKTAQKADKYSHIELVNDALSTMRLYARRDSRFAEDSWLMEWDRDKSSGDKLVVSDAFHSDICDAVLYAFREAMHWIKVPSLPKSPSPNTPEWMVAEMERMEELALKRMERAQEQDEQWEEIDWNTAI